MWRGINKRRFPRANYKCVIIIKRNLFSTRIKTETENIGVGGICVVLNKRLRTFEEVSLNILLDNGLGPIECKGRVMWEVKKELPTNKTLYDTGIEFINLKNDGTERIEKIVEGLMKGK